MLFNSFQFILWFCPLVIGVYYFLSSSAGRRSAQIWLLLSSLFFYAWTALPNLWVLLGSIVFNWFISQRIASQTDEGRRKTLLVVGLSANILCLATFKYANLGGFPLGLSFFTLQQIMYLVDCYEGLAPANSLFDHSLFVAFFPYVTVGPITRAKSMVSQFSKRDKSRDVANDLVRAAFIFSIGLFKKVIFADSFARLADAGFLHPNDLSTLETWAITVAYTMQIYFDFSGYSDMAIGAALALGYDIPVNFNAPYRAQSIIEFWQRWHITLSNFITTYLYTPMLRSFKKVTLHKAALATLIAMAIAGVWHGAGWTFVTFGLLHGLGLVINQYWKKTKIRLPGVIAWALTFAFVNLAFIFFRAPDMTTALSIAGRLIPGDSLLSITALRTSIRGVELQVMMIPLMVGTAAAFLGKSSQQLQMDFKPTWRSAFAVAGLMLTAFLFMNSRLAQEFVYFAF